MVTMYFFNYPTLFTGFLYESLILNSISNDTSNGISFGIFFVIVLTTLFYFSRMIFVILNPPTSSFGSLASDIIIFFIISKILPVI